MVRSMVLQILRREKTASLLPSFFSLDIAPWRSRCNVSFTFWIRGDWAARKGCRGILVIWYVNSRYWDTSRSKRFTEYNDTSSSVVPKSSFRKNNPVSSFCNVECTANKRQIG